MPRWHQGEGGQVGAGGCDAVAWPRAHIRAEQDLQRLDEEMVWPDAKHKIEAHVATVELEVADEGEGELHAVQGRHVSRQPPGVRLPARTKALDGRARVLRRRMGEPAASG